MLDNRLFVKLKCALVVECSGPTGLFSLILLGWCGWGLLLLQPCGVLPLRSSRLRLTAALFSCDVKHLENFPFEKFALVFSTSGPLCLHFQPCCRVVC